MNNVGIAILSYFRLDRLKKCIDALYRNTTTPFDLYFVDNASDDKTKDYLRSLSKEKGVHGAFLGDNVGWTAGKNGCLWLIRDYPIQILMENDVTCRSRVKGMDWIELHLWAMDKLGLPMLQGRHSMKQHKDEGYLLRVEKEEVKIRLHEDFLTRMMIVKKEVIDKLGGFVWEMNMPWGAYVDVEYGERLLKAYAQKTGLMFHVSLDDSIFEFKEIQGSEYKATKEAHKQAIEVHGKLFIRRRKWIHEKATLKELKVPLIPMGTGPG